MFTGIVEEIGFIKNIDGHKLTIECSKVLEETKIGDSISVNGCCQTVISKNSNSFSTNLSPETLKITKGFKTNEKVNLERALTLNSRMGGHIVQGHIDGIAKFISNGKFETSEEIIKYIVYKGAVTIDGVSLTISKVGKNVFETALIPHTLQNTTLQYLKYGDFVNVETDILGRYIEKFLSTQDNNITEDFLKENGFL